MNNNTMELYAGCSSYNCARYVLLIVVQQHIIHSISTGTLPVCLCVPLSLLPYCVPKRKDKLKRNTDFVSHYCSAGV